MGEPIDPSRYRTAAAIVERHQDGESLDSIAKDYQLGGWWWGKPADRDRYLVELIIAASDADRILDAADDDGEGDDADPQRFDDEGDTSDTWEDPDLRRSPCPAVDQAVQFVLQEMSHGPDELDEPLATLATILHSLYRAGEEAGASEAHAAWCAEARALRALLGRAGAEELDEIAHRLDGLVAFGRDALDEMLAEARAEGMDEVADAFESDAKQAKPGMTFQGGPLHGASICNVNIRAARKIRGLAAARRKAGS